MTGEWPRSSWTDTNVIVYANDDRDTVKQQRAIDLVTTATREGTGVVSTQVMQEYAMVASTKLAQNDDAILRQLQSLESLEIVVVQPPLIQRALEMSGRRISYWDACILAAAEHARCPVVLSEDFNPGQLHASTRVDNPFV